ncbi:MAG TPA: hypothetical protein ENJ08_04475 [Gammaproteobacteria bacterium]|nr:hypothetical protein [Gammaproteobacteria bacterium]
MNQTLPVHLNFAQKAKVGFEIQGKWPIKQLKRVKDSLMSEEGELQVELKFDRIGPVPIIYGHIKTELQLKCQRCMQPVTHTVDFSFKLGLVQNEAQMEKLPDDLDPYLVEDDINHLPDMLEDELLLALPLVPMHEFECSAYLQNQETDQQDEVEEPEKKENPFSVLKDLL